MDRPFYKQRPIGSLQALGETLGYSEPLLIKLATNASKYYRIAPEIKKTDGSIRTVFSVGVPLKTVQGRIKKKLLDKIYYPVYLQGGIRDRENPRDYVKNAGIHAGCTTLINEDISDFFPSVSDKVVFDIWMHFFNFPRSVAKILTKLTIKDGALPQGASTSCHLANLVFWETEPILVDKLLSTGFVYTRFIDDISVSSLTRITGENKGEIISMIRRMTARNNLHLKPRKHKIYSSGGRMLVTNLVVNKKTSISSEERARIRAAVHQCELSARNKGDGIGEFKTLLLSTKGRVRHLARFHQKEARALMSRLAILNEDNR